MMTNTTLQMVCQNLGPIKLAPFEGPLLSTKTTCQETIRYTTIYQIPCPLGPILLLGPLLSTFTETMRTMTQSKKTNKKTETVNIIVCWNVPSSANFKVNPCYTVKIEGVQANADQFLTTRIRSFHL